MATALIIDDEKDLCALLSMQLKSLQVTNDFVHTVPDGKSLLNQNQYDVLFLDLHIADGSGFDILAFLKTKPSKPKVIVITAYDAERYNVLQAGADLVLAKPFGKKDVIGALEAVLPFN